MSTRELPPSTVGMPPAMPRQLVARHLIILATTMALISVILMSDNPLAHFCLLLLPAAGLAVARVVTVPFATPELIRGYHWATWLLLMLGVASAAGYVPGPASLVALGFVWVGWSRRAHLLAGAALATLLAVAPIDVAGPLKIAESMFESPAHATAFAGVAVALGLLALWESRRA